MESGIHETYDAIRISWQWGKTITKFPFFPCKNAGGQGIQANVAQPVEHLICNQAVVGSNPFVGLFAPEACREGFGKGSMPEWLMGADCKSAGYAYGGSNPPRPISKVRTAKGGDPGRRR